MPRVSWNCRHVPQDRCFSEMPTELLTCCVAPAVSEKSGGCKQVDITPLRAGSIDL